MHRRSAAARRRHRLCKYRESSQQQTHQDRYHKTFAPHPAQQSERLNADRKGPPMGPFALFRLQSHRLSAILKPSNNHIAVTGVGHLQTSQQATRVSVRVMKYVGASACTGIWSSAGGVVQRYPKPTRLIGRKEMLIALSRGRAIFVDVFYFA